MDYCQTISLPTSHIKSCILIALWSDVVIRDLSMITSITNVTKKSHPPFFYNISILSDKETCNIIKSILHFLSSKPSLTCFYGLLNVQIEEPFISSLLIAFSHTPFLFPNRKQSKTLSATAYFTWDGLLQKHIR